MAVEGWAKSTASFVSCRIIACLLLFCLFHVSAIWCCSFTLYKLERRTASLPCVMSCLYSYRISIVFVCLSLRRGSVDLNEGNHMRKCYTKSPRGRVFLIKSTRKKDQIKRILFFFFKPPPPPPFPHPSFLRLFFPIFLSLRLRHEPQYANEAL